MVSTSDRITSPDHTNPRRRPTPEAYEKAARIRIHFASACPDAALFRLLAGRLAASGP